MEMAPNSVRVISRPSIPTYNGNVKVICLKAMESDRIKVKTYITSPSMTSDFDMCENRKKMILHLHTSSHENSVHIYIIMCLSVCLS